MDFKIFICIIYLASSISPSSSSSCELKNYTNGCNYVVQCERTAGSVSNPNCDVDPYVTFIITNSHLPSITTGFFAATNFDSRVREIKSQDNSWEQIESATFRYYTKCLRMDLSNTNIAKINSEAFRNLANMKYLNLSSNRIESFRSKSFLITDSKMNDLQVLDLSDNQLQYIDSELNEVPNLKTLYLQNNMLFSVADDAFMNLKDLSHLYLQNNLLTSVNLSFIHLKSLRVLDVSHNHLIKLAGYEINRLVALVDFNISHNELTSVESNCFNQAFNLEKVDFSYNDIKMAIDNVMFINNNKLGYLNFYRNRIFGLQENAFQHCSLYYLNLEKNNITGDLKENTLSNLKNLSAFDLSQQSFTGIRNKAFVNAENLRNLNLSRNSISVVENSSFINASISVLDLSYNKVPSICFLKNCLTNLTELYLNNNNITYVAKNSFSVQTLMKKLDLSMNNIIMFEEFSLPLNNLQYLNIVGNRLNDALKRNVFSPAKYLRFLDLSHFNISRVESLAFADLPVLAKLNLSNNHITGIATNSFKGVGNLFSLDISNNKLKEIKLNISKLTNLKALMLSNNNVSTISGLFTSPCKLTYLDLSKNNIEDVSQIGSYILPNLTVLYLDKNNVKNFNNPQTNSLTTLIDLGLSSNEISNITLSYFKDLMSVDLSNNNLTSINSEFLAKNEYLQALDLSRNKLTDLPPGTFQFMRNLKLLNLSSNYLSKLRYGSLKGLHKTEILDLSRNNITKLDVDVFHECDELKTLIIDYNRIKTFDVERLIIIALRKLRTLSLGGNPILCKEIVHNIKAANTTFYAIRQVEVTSIDRIYHEDNVHGIQCGDDPDPTLSTLIKSDAEKTKSDAEIISSFTSNAAVLIWCSILTIVIATSGTLVYLKLYRKRVIIVDKNLTMQLRSSIDYSGSDYQRDLLS